MKDLKLKRDIEEFKEKRKEDKVKLNLHKRQKRGDTYLNFQTSGPSKLRYVDKSIYF